MDSLVFGKTLENVKKHRYIRLLTFEKTGRYFVSEPNYYTTKWFSVYLLGIETNKTKVKMNTPICLGLSIL